MPLPPVRVDFISLFLDDPESLSPPPLPLTRSYLPPPFYVYLCMAFPFSGRLSYTFDLRGPATSINSACSSSLVAAHFAREGLMASSLFPHALVGGVMVRETPLLEDASFRSPSIARELTLDLMCNQVMLLPGYTMACEMAGMLTSDGRCKTLDAAADGYSRGEACATVLFQVDHGAGARLQGTGGLFAGSAINQDGRSSSLTAPRGPAQRDAIHAALASATLSPGNLAGLELHGTGTSLGDPIELGAAQLLVNERAGRTSPLLLLAMKSHAGHAEPAAGVSQFLHALKSLTHGESSTILHLRQMNAYISPTSMSAPRGTSFGLPSSSSALSSRGISSFAFQGTNAHAVLIHPTSPAVLLEPSTAIYFRAKCWLDTIPADRILGQLITASNKNTVRISAAIPSPAFSSLNEGLMMGRPILPTSATLYFAASASESLSLEHCRASSSAPLGLAHAVLGAPSLVPSSSPPESFSFSISLGAGSFEVVIGSQLVCKGTVSSPVVDSGPRESLKAAAQCAALSPHVLATMGATVSSIPLWDSALLLKPAENPASVIASVRLFATARCSDASQPLAVALDSARLPSTTLLGISTRPLSFTNVTDSEKASSDFYELVWQAAPLSAKRITTSDAAALPLLSVFAADSATRFHGEHSSAVFFMRAGGTLPAALTLTEVGQTGHVAGAPSSIVLRTTATHPVGASGHSLASLSGAALQAIARSMCTDSSACAAFDADLLEPHSSESRHAEPPSSCFFRLARRGNVSYLAAPLRRQAVLRGRSEPAGINGEVVITGGSGSLGARVAAWLVETTAGGQAPLLSSIRLVSRTAQFASSDGTSAALLRGQRFGGMLTLQRADTATLEGAHSLFEAGRRHSPVCGFFHAGGTTSDALFPKLSVANYRVVFAPKDVSVLSPFMGAAPLNFFFLFSSISSFLGLSGAVRVNHFL